MPKLRGGRPGFRGKGNRAATLVERGMQFVTFAWLGGTVASFRPHRLNHGGG